jgi:hypothetical protein
MIYDTLRLLASGAIANVTNAINAEYKFNTSTATADQGLRENLAFRHTQAVEVATTCTNRVESFTGSGTFLNVTTSSVQWLHMIH